MDLQTMLSNAMAAHARERFEKSGQLSLGELILKLEAVTDRDKVVQYDFGDYYPSSIDSWRGSYAELALDCQQELKLTTNELLDILKNTVGETLQGYKGGDFYMSRQTPIWVANHGNSSLCLDTYKGIVSDWNEGKEFYDTVNVINVVEECSAIKLITQQDNY